MRGPIRIDREVYVNVITHDGEWMGDIQHTSNDQTGDDLYWAEVANGESRGFDSEEAAIDYIEERWKARDAS